MRSGLHGTAFTVKASLQVSSLVVSSLRPWARSAHDGVVWGSSAIVRRRHSRARGTTNLKGQQSEGGVTIEGSLNAPHGSSYHIPVLCEEVTTWLVTDPEGTYLDCTLGGGGHSSSILTRLRPPGKLIALDRDPDALAFASKRLETHIASGMFSPIQSNFADATRAIKDEGLLPEGGFAGEMEILY